MSVTFFPRRRLGDVLAVSFLGFCLLILAGPVVLAGLDRNQRCVSNVGILAMAVLQYTQDYDETLPLPVALSSAANFQTFLTAYVPNHDPAVFRCPANGNAYYTPNAAIAGKTLASFPYADEAEALRDSKPHPDGKLTIGFLDGHIERGGINQTPTEVLCRQRANIVNLALANYTYNYDEKLPFQKNDDEFRQVLQPYVAALFHSRRQSVWVCPDTLQFFYLNPDIRGKTLAEFPDTAPVVVVEDVVPHRDGLVTTGYLDGYTEQRGPKGVTYPYPIPSPESSAADLHHFGFALINYTQDYDETFPLYKSYPELLQTLRPYFGHSSRYYQRLQRPAVEVNLDLSGVTGASIAEPASTIVLRDVFNFGDGMITAEYVDGHVARIPSKRPIKNSGSKITPPATKKDGTP